MNAVNEQAGHHWVAEQQCREVVVRAAVFVDARDYQAFAGLFTDDGVLERPGGTPVRGRAAILETYRLRPADRITRHLVTNIVVTSSGANSAHVKSYVLLWSGSEADAAGQFGRPAHERQVVGEFEDFMVETAIGWRISRRHARFVLFLESAS